MRTLHFITGLAVLAAVLAGPLAAAAHERFSAHMVQHLALTAVVAPLLLLGAPVSLLLRALSPTHRHAVRPLVAAAGLATRPAIAWVVFATVMWLSHFSPLYDLALRSEAAHALEHALYLGAAILFWWPVVGLDPGGRLSPPARLLYLAGALPVQSFLGLAIYSSDEVLYPHYAPGPGALADQRVAALVMWLGGDALMIVAIGFAAAAWMRHDRKETLRVDRRLGT